MSEEHSTIAGRSSGSLPAPLALALAVLTTLLLAIAGLASPAAHASATRQLAASQVATRSATGQLGALASHRYKFKFSGIAFTGTRIVIAATDSKGDLDMFWQKTGTSKWQKEVVARGRRGHRYAKASITWTGTDVAIAAVNSSGDLFYFAQRPGASHWKRQLLGTASQGEYGAPSISAEPGLAILISSATTSGELVLFQLLSPSTTWTQDDVRSGTFGAPSVLVTSGLEEIAAPSGTVLLFFSRDVGATTWSEEEFGMTGSVTNARLAATNTTLLLTTSVDGEVLFLTEQIGTVGWTEQEVAAGTGSNAYRNPQITWTAATNGDSVSFDVITATTAGGRLVFWWAYSGSATPVWTLEIIASPARRASYTSPGIGITAKSVVITDINRKPGNVDFWLQKFGATPWHHQVVARG